MTTYTQEEIDQHYHKLPETLRDELMSAEHAEHVFEVGKKFGLTIEQTGFLAEETGFVVLGLTHPKDFVRHLSERLGIDMEKTKAITQEINHHVFFPLREMLKNAHKFELTQEQIQTPPPPLPPISRPAERVNTPSSQGPISTPRPPIIPPAPQTTTQPLQAERPFPRPSAPANTVGTPPVPINIAELLKTKELTTPAPTGAPIEEKKLSPLAPSQILQQKLGEEQNKSVPADTPTGAPVATPQAPAQPTPPSTPLTQKPSYPSNDPYREPIE